MSYAWNVPPLVSTDPAVTAVRAFEQVQSGFERWLDQDHDAFLDIEETRRQEDDWIADFETKLAAAARAIPTPAKTLAAMRALARAVPSLAGGHVIRFWSGIEAYLPDMIPVIGPSETTPGLFHAFGFCGPGSRLDRVWAFASAR